MHFVLQIENIRMHLRNKVQTFADGVFYLQTKIWLLLNLRASFTKHLAKVVLFVCCLVLALTGNELHKLKRRLFPSARRNISWTDTSRQFTERPNKERLNKCHSRGCNSIRRRSDSEWGVTGGFAFFPWTRRHRRGYGSTEGQSDIILTLTIPFASRWDDFFFLPCVKFSTTNLLEQQDRPAGCIADR